MASIREFWAKAKIRFFASTFNEIRRTNGTEKVSKIAWKTEIIF